MEWNWIEFLGIYMLDIYLYYTTNTVLKYKYNIKTSCRKKLFAVYFPISFLLDFIFSSKRFLFSYKKMKTTRNKICSIEKKKEKEKT